MNRVVFNGFLSRKVRFSLQKLAATRWERSKNSMDGVGSLNRRLSVQQACSFSNKTWPSCRYHMASPDPLSIWPSIPGMLLWHFSCTCSSWFIMVHHGASWCIMVHHGSCIFEKYRDAQLHMVSTPMLPSVARGHGWGVQICHGAASD